MQSCITDHRDPNPGAENPATFKEAASIDLGGTASAEISAYDLSSKRLFVVNNVTDNYSVKTLTFEWFAGSQAQLANGGFRVYGPNATPAQDVEPEYVAVSPDLKKAWVRLQENNGMVEVDLVSGTILRIVPFATKDYNLAANAIDPSDRDSKIELRTAPAKSFFLPDAISYFSANGANFVITADEGNTRQYPAFNEQVRAGSLTPDATAFPTGSTLKQNTNLGRLRVTSTAGNSNGTYNGLFGFGGRGFSIYNATTGERVYEAGKTP